MLGRETCRASSQPSTMAPGQHRRVIAIAPVDHYGPYDLGDQLLKGDERSRSETWLADNCNSFVARRDRCPIMACTVRF
jgi:hypothetical protein